MSNGRRKTGIILALYSLVITLMFLSASILFIKTAAPPKSDLPEGFLIINNVNILQSLESENLRIPLNSVYTTFLKTSSIENYYMKELVRYFFPVMFGLFIIITFITWVLWKVLNKQNEQQALFVAKELSGIGEDGEPVHQHAAIQKSYMEIKGKLDAYVSDYMRLSSYITHEQKNTLSLLRAKLQITGNGELINEVDKVTASIDDILTLSAFRNMEQNEVVDAALVCANVCDDYRKVYPKIWFHFDDEEEYRIHARPIWIYRAVSNLVDNAVKYGNNSDINVSIRNKKRSVIITVSDQGHGIDTESQEKLFTNRYRVSHLNKNGYGIGLNLVKHVSELCGGVIWVESEINRGTTFYLVFPEALTLD